MVTNETDLIGLLGRIADALERLSPARPEPTDLTSADAFVWHAETGRLTPVTQVSRIPVDLLRGIELQRRQLTDNTRRFRDGLPANNALLWGARGMGKSSLVKAVHAAVNEELATEHKSRRVALIEIHREDIATLPRLLDLMRAADRRCVLFCDDLSFDTADTSYKSLKAVLEGGIEGRPDHVLFYATSNRRHLMPRDMIENERSTAIIAGEAVEEKVSLSDRFGLWLGFHACDQQTYLHMIAGYIDAFGLPIEEDVWRPDALQWSVTRGGRSGRVAWQYLQDLAGRLGCRLSSAD